MIPKYQVIINDLLREINENKFEPGDQIYSEIELKNKYDVSNTTVVKALNTLVQKGYLIRKQGKGTFVRRNLINKKVIFSEDSPVSHLTDSEAIEKTDTYVSTNCTDGNIVKKLDKTLNKDEKLVQVIQVGYINDIVWKIQLRYFLQKDIEENSLRKIQDGKSITRELIGNEREIESNININVIQVSQDYKYYNLVKKYIYNNNEVQENPAYFEIENIKSKFGDNPFEYSLNLINSNYYSINIKT